MPDISGLKVLKKFKAEFRQRKIPVVMVTTSHEVETAAECILNGANDFITKPSNSILLKARIGACLEKMLVRQRRHSF